MAGIVPPLGGGVVADDARDRCVGAHLLRQPRLALVRLATSFGHQAGRGACAVVRAAFAACDRGAPAAPRVRRTAAGDLPDRAGGLAIARLVPGPGRVLEAAGSVGYGIIASKARGK